MGETEPGAEQLDQQIWGDKDEDAGEEGTLLFVAAYKIVCMSTPLF